MKLKRAEKHLQELKDEITAYQQKNPFRISEEETPDGDLLYKLNIIDPVPAEEWACIVGDILHNLRSALDLRITELVVLNNGIVSERHCFPISTNEDKFNTLYLKKKVLEGVNNISIQKILNLKPYLPYSPLLWELHDLDISDKHRQLIIASASYESFSLNNWSHLANLDGPLADGLKQMIQEGKVPKIGIRPANTMFPLKDGYAVLIIKAQVRKGITYDKPEFRFEIAYSKIHNDKGELLVPKLETLVKITKNILTILS